MVLPEKLAKIVLNDKNLRSVALARGLSTPEVPYITNIPFSLDRVDYEERQAQRKRPRKQELRNNSRSFGITQFIGNRLRIGLHSYTLGNDRPVDYI